ncbi:hypothetical protein [Pantoea sp. S18]|uniref:hypothetical protein n=1 Tax=Pantoea sp. S18 TaxID=3019892 RepID=UPI002B2090B3|nr:hypothetical protein [Pantoea sp. S18]MEA5105705.1 hypothetical protein [Pantoea sp. S18]
MNISYDEIKSDSKVMAEAILSSKKIVPSFFYPLKCLRYHLSVYLIFAVLSFFLPDMNGDILIGLGVLAFGLLNWVFIFAFSSGYVNLFSMINTPEVRGLKLTKVLVSKLKTYSLVWLVLMVVLGMVTITTEINIGALVFGNFVLTLVGLFILTIDLSRFQLSGLLGTASAVKNHLSH